MKLRCLHALLSLICFFATACRTSEAAEIRVIEKKAEPAFGGKEVDWIYGDYFMSNDQISLVIAAPLETRDANLTVRNVGATILDLSLNYPSNDQLSAFFPAAGRYLFQDPSLVEIGKEGDGVYWQCRSSKALKDQGTTATVRYRLVDGESYVEATISIEGESAEKIKPYDGVRADNTFFFNAYKEVAFCSDTFFRQTIGFETTTGEKAPTWKRGRPYELHYHDGQFESSENSLSWTVRIYPTTSPLDLSVATDDAFHGQGVYTFEVTPETTVKNGYQTIVRAKLEVRRADRPSDVATPMVSLSTDDQGKAHARLLPGKYNVTASAIGYGSVTVVAEIDGEGGLVQLPLKESSGFSADTKDENGVSIPAKATIYAVEGDDPDFGPDSTRTFVKNCVYSVRGKFYCPLDPGTYEVYFSRGPEYDSVVRTIEIQKNESPSLSIVLPRVVDTSGWISTEMHSHSSPSGDNTSDQYGRVENLLCEHLEFAPCTEHGRISSYAPHLRQMQLAHLMATCTGMEVTGSPLPVNHQNTFPLHHHPHTQNGGGPRTDPNPEVQIERVAMWDDRSDKVVQMNHPNLHQIFGDLDVDETPDKGFRRMLDWTDVIEVHPLQTIFEDVVSQPPSIKKMRIPIFQWMQLLNQGYRIPGVVNTDAHYNHHGSGWLRNWFACSTDDPAKISTDEMIEQAEAGHIIMSTGPYLSVTGVSKTSDKVAIPGDDLEAANGEVTLDVRVQCPNWLDINRVQVFVNGRPNEQHNYTRRSDSDRFGQAKEVVKFDSELGLSLKSDAHLIVAVIGEGMSMEKVMGTQYGKVPPVAVSNPIFVDVDGNGFRHNGDELGLPLPRVKSD